MQMQMDFPVPSPTHSFINIPSLGTWQRSSVGRTARSPIVHSVRRTHSLSLRLGNACPRPRGSESEGALNNDSQGFFASVAASLGASPSTSSRLIYFGFVGSALKRAGAAEGHGMESSP